MVDKQAGINSYWDQRAQSYHRDQQLRGRKLPIENFWYGQLLKVLPDSPLKILDVGTGNGSWAMILATLGHRVTGIDLSAGMLKQAGLARQEAQERGQKFCYPPLFGQGDAMAPAYAPERFDLVTNRYLMWTLLDPALALRNWYRLLKPGGMLLLVDAPWFKAGIAAQANKKFTRFYHRQLRAALPLAEAKNLDPLLQFVQASPFQNVEVSALPELLELDRRLGVAAGHEPELQYLLTAHKPGRY